MTPMLRSARALLGSALLASPLVACDSITGTDDLSRAQSELDRNWDRFERSAPLSYSYIVRVDCECPSDVTRPVTVWVDRGTIEYLLYEDDGRPVPFSYANSFPSVEQLFDAIQDGIDRRADYIDVDYDPTYGYPTNVYIDYDRRVADEELSLTTWGLARWD
jgi:Family of unknown function (DUF6174)